MSDAPVFDAYVESMRPMFETLARTARGEGESEKYDTIAYGIGAPSSDELIGPDERCGTLRVPYRYTVVHTGYVNLHVDDAQRWANGEADESDAFEEYEDVIRELVEADVENGNTDIDSAEVEPHSSDYVTFENYC